ncbi:hypothetical protein PR048_028476 [Dryococelus australis]|uniref:Uncharacterized protein n=1 Tax=Dryococelus australis TaxID=614101 RepID=A0ABQ9GAM7_9NEOP|nr:hypothetical protein PR048_028476 [Dryococelus australis]
MHLYKEKTANHLQASQLETFVKPGLHDAQHAARSGATRRHVALYPTSSYSLFIVNDIKLAAPREVASAPLSTQPANHLDQYCIGLSQAEIHSPNKRREHKETKVACYRFNTASDCTAISRYYTIPAAVLGSCTSFYKPWCTSRYTSRYMRRHGRFVLHDSSSRIRYPRSSSSHGERPTLGNCDVIGQVRNMVWDMPRKIGHVQLPNLVRNLVIHGRKCHDGCYTSPNTQRTYKVELKQGFQKCSFDREQPILPVTARPSTADHTPHATLNNDKRPLITEPFPTNFISQALHFSINRTFPTIFIASVLLIYEFFTLYSLLQCSIGNRSDKGDIATCITYLIAAKCKTLNWSSAGPECKCGGKLKIPEKTGRPAAYRPARFPHAKIRERPRQESNPNSWWEASSLTTKPPRPPMPVLRRVKNGLACRCMAQISSSDLTPTGLPMQRHNTRHTTANCDKQDVVIAAGKDGRFYRNVNQYASLDWKRPHTARIDWQYLATNRVLWAGQWVCCSCSANKQHGSTGEKTAEVRDMINDLCHKKKSYSQMADVVGRSRATVQSIDKRRKDSTRLDMVRMYAHTSEHECNLELSVGFSTEHGNRSRVSRKKPYIHQQTEQKEEICLCLHRYVDFWNTYVTGTSIPIAQPASRTLHCLILAVADFPSADHFFCRSSFVAKTRPLVKWPGKFDAPRTEKLYTTKISSTHGKKDYRVGSLCVTEMRPPAYRSPVIHIDPLSCCRRCHITAVLHSHSLERDTKQRARSKKTHGSQQSRVWYMDTTRRQQGPCECDCAARGNKVRVNVTVPLGVTSCESSAAREAGRKPGSDQHSRPLVGRPSYNTAALHRQSWLSCQPNTHESKEPIFAKVKVVYATLRLSSFVPHRSSSGKLAYMILGVDFKYFLQLSNVDWRRLILLFPTSSSQTLLKIDLCKRNGKNSNTASSVTEQQLCNDRHVQYIRVDNCSGYHSVGELSTLMRVREGRWLAVRSGENQWTRTLSARTRHAGNVEPSPTLSPTSQTQHRLLCPAPRPRYTANVPLAIYNLVNSSPFTHVTDIPSNGAKLLADSYNGSKREKRPQYKRPGKLKGTVHVSPHPVLFAVRRKGSSHHDIYDWLRLPYEFYYTTTHNNTLAHSRRNQGEPSDTRFLEQLLIAIRSRLSLSGRHVTRLLQITFAQCEINECDAASYPTSNKCFSGQTLVYHFVDQNERSLYYAATTSTSRLYDNSWHYHGTSLQLSATNQAFATHSGSPDELPVYHDGRFHPNLHGRWYGLFCGRWSSTFTVAHDTGLCSVAPSWFETRSEIGSKIETENCCTIRIKSWNGERDEVHFEPSKLGVRNLDPRSAANIDESEIQIHEIPLLQHFKIGTKVKLCPGSELGSGKMLALARPASQLLMASHDDDGGYHPSKQADTSDAARPATLTSHTAASREVPLRRRRFPSTTPRYIDTRRYRYHAAASRPCLSPQQSFVRFPDRTNLGILIILQSCWITEWTANAVLFTYAIARVVSMVGERVTCCSVGYQTSTEDLFWLVSWAWKPPKWIALTTSGWNGTGFDSWTGMCIPGPECLGGSDEEIGRERVGREWGERVGRECGERVWERERGRVWGKREGGRVSRDVMLPSSDISNRCPSPLNRWSVSRTLGRSHTRMRGLCLPAGDGSTDSCMRTAHATGDKLKKQRDRGGGAVRLLACHQDEPCISRGRVTPEFSQAGIAPDNAAGRRVLFSLGSPVSTALAFRRCSILTSYHPHRLFAKRSMYGNIFCEIAVCAQTRISDVNTARLARRSDETLGVRVNARFLTLDAQLHDTLNSQISQLHYKHNSGTTYVLMNEFRLVRRQRLLYESRDEMHTVSWQESRPTRG